MPNYLPFNYNQSSMIVINFNDQLQPGSFEYAIHYLIEHKIDLSIFDKHYKNDEVGRPAYHPAILLKILLFAYSKGITSSREIEWCCQTNVIFKALCVTPFLISQVLLSSPAATRNKLKISLAKFS